MLTALKALGTILSLGTSLAAPTSQKKLIQEAELLASVSNPKDKEYLVQRLLAETPSRRGRRFVAMSVTGVWMFTVIAPVILELLAIAVPLSLVTAAATVKAPFIAVISFYFLANKTSELGNLVKGVSNIMRNK